MDLHKNLPSAYVVSVIAKRAVSLATINVHNSLSLMGVLPSKDIACYGYIHALVFSGCQIFFIVYVPSRNVHDIFPIDIPYSTCKMFMW